MTTSSSDALGRAARALGLDAVLESVAQRATGEHARRRLRARRPQADPAAVAAAQDAVAATQAFLDRHGDLPVDDTAWRDDAERIAARPDAADGVGLRRIAAGERTAQALARALGAAREDPGFAPLAAQAAGLDADPELARAIERAIDDDGEVRDEASPELARARRRARREHERARAQADSAARRLGGDAHVTVVGERFVVVAPRRRVRESGGLVHGASQTGESVYVEPAALVAANNAAESARAAAHVEARRVVRGLGERVRDAADRLARCADAIERVDVLRAIARFAQARGARRPDAAPDGSLRLVAGRHPVLETILERAGRALVPLDVSLEAGRRVLVISGPNAGGKTVALSTVGILACMHQAGLPVPCGEGTRLPVWRAIHVDVGDGQSLQASLSTFTSHVERLDAMLRDAGGDVLCLIDEIGDGTDPDEGAALAVAVLEALRARGATVLATTHMGRVKTWALEAPGVENASMAFDPSDGRPLYRLHQGIAGRSHGLETARRMGLDADVVARAAARLGDDAFRLDAVLAALEARTRELERERERLVRRTRQLEDAIAKWRARAESYRMTRDAARRRAAREAREVLESARAEVERVVGEVRRRGAAREAVRKARERLAERLAEVRRLERQAEPPPALETVVVGQRVSTSPAGRPVGTVVDVRRGRAVVAINGRRITIPTGSLYAPAPGADAPPPDAIDVDVPAVTLDSHELDLRGLDRAEALERLGAFVDRAVLAGVEEVRVIHGVGTGVLASTVREFLRGDRRVGSFRPAERFEGGAGATIVRFD